MRKEDLFEIEVNDCICDGGSVPFGKFNNLEEFIENCNRSLFLSHSSPRFSQSVTRKSTFDKVLTLKDIAKSRVRSLLDSYDDLEIPIALKTELTHILPHNHFKMALNEIEDKKPFLERHYEHFGFKSPTTGVITIMGIANLKIWEMNHFSTKK